MQSQLRWMTWWRALAHGGFPISPQEAENPGDPIELHGTITRNLLLKMLTHRVAFFDPDLPREALFETPGERDELLVINPST